MNPARERLPEEYRLKLKYPAPPVELAPTPESKASEVPDVVEAGPAPDIAEIALAGETPEEPRLLSAAWQEVLAVSRATRSWVQYGALGFAVLCILIGAVEALLGK